jgi:hypothetical protein
MPTICELQIEAKKKGLKGYSKLKKSALERFVKEGKSAPKKEPKKEPPKEEPKKTQPKLNEKKYNLIQKILKELDRLEGNYGDDRDPFGYVKDFLILPKKQGKTKKQIIDDTFKYLKQMSKTNQDLKYKFTHRTMLINLWSQLQKLFD